MTTAPAFISFLVCLTSPRLAAMWSGVSPRSFRLFTFFSAGVRLVDVTDGGGDEGFGEESIQMIDQAPEYTHYYSEPES